MVDIQPHTVLDETFSDGKPWLVTVDRRFNKSITLDLTKFGDALKSPDKSHVLSGIALKKVGTTYEPATAADDYEGILFTPRQVVAGSTKTTAALMTHGAIVDALCPGGLPTGAGPALIRHDV